MFDVEQQSVCSGRSKPGLHCSICMHVFVFVFFVMYVHSLCLNNEMCGCVKCQPGTEAIEVETLTQNNEAVPYLPVNGETSTELCSL